MLIRTAFKHLWRYAIAIGIPATLFAAIATWPGAPSGQAVATVIGVDADPTGNSANSLGTRDACVEVDVGEDFDVDVYIEGANDLLGFNLYFGYNPSLVELRDPAHESLLITGIDQPDPFSDYYFIGVGNSHGGPGANGEGVLVRMHLHAKASGVSEASVRSTPAPPELLTTSGSTFHSSPILNAQIAVGQSCSGAPTLPPTPTAPPTLPPTASPTNPPVTQAPTPTHDADTIPWGDANCMQGVTIDDAIAIAKLKVGVPITPIGTPCPNVGAEVVGGSIEVDWGDFDCSGQFNLADAIAIMRYLIGIATGAPAGCPSIATNYVSFP